MRISDWSSDVCSSDLGYTVAGTGGDGCIHVIIHRITGSTVRDIYTIPTSRCVIPTKLPDYVISYIGIWITDRRIVGVHHGRSAERRVGKVCVSTFRSRWSPEH